MPTRARVQRNPARLPGMQPHSDAGGRRPSRLTSDGGSRSTTRRRTGRTAASMQTSTPWSMGSTMAGMMARPTTVGAQRPMPGPTAARCASHCDARTTRLIVRPGMRTDAWGGGAQRQPTRRWWRLARAHKRLPNERIDRPGRSPHRSRLFRHRGVLRARRAEVDWRARGPRRRPEHAPPRPSWPCPPYRRRRIRMRPRKRAPAPGDASQAPRTRSRRSDEATVDRPAVPSMGRGIDSPPARARSVETPRRAAPGGRRVTACGGARRADGRLAGCDRTSLA